jgi:predicted metalloprotease
MQWSSGDRSNIEDDRGRSGSRAVPLGIGGVIVLGLLSWATGINFLPSSGTPQSAPAGSVGTQGQVQSTPQEEKTVDFVDAVAKDVQDMWARTLGARYERTRIALFRDSIDSACGAAESATGPFYCPSDGKVYLDVGFFDELTRRFGAPGDFAKAYVIAHELGHHVQHLLGLDAGARRGAATGPNSASVALELQADCLAGVWGHTASQSGRFKAGHVELDAGDAEQALHAAAAIGDDRLQKMTTGHVMPDRFTHGTSAQRVDAFKRGMESGELRACGAAARSTQ